MSILQKIVGAFVETPETKGPEAPATPVVPNNAKSISASDVNAQLAALDAQLKGNKGVSQFVDSTSSQTLNEAKAQTPEQAPTVTADGKLDFDAIYRISGIPDNAYGAEETLEMFATLPRELPIEAKIVALQQILNTINRLNPLAIVTPDTLITDAERKITALENYANSISAQVKKYNATCDGEIASLTARIQSIEASKVAAQQQNDLTLKVCQAQIAKLEEVPKSLSRRY